jgi:hypothetical protein
MPIGAAVFEFQVSASKFLKDFTEKIKAAAIPLTGAIVVPNQPTLYVDHLEFKDASLRQEESTSYSVQSKYFGQIAFDSVAGKRLQVIQPVTIFVAGEFKSGGAIASGEPRIG